MSDYGLIYTVPFAALDDTPCVVEIEREGYTGASAELVAGGSPFTVDIADDEFLYVTTRLSTATLRVVGSDYLQELFSTQYRQHRVTLKRGGVVQWCGFIKPEVYTQDYTDDTFEFEIACQSAMSVLEYLDYTKEEGDDGDLRFVSLWRLLQRCVEESRGQYTAVYVPYVYAHTADDYASGERNVLDCLYLSEQNLFDEEGKPWKLLEVLEEVCKFLGWTCADWQGSLYLVDVDHTGEYRRYAPDMESYDGTLTPGTKSVQAMGFAGSGHSLDILPGYNKVTVKCSNYPVGTLLDFSVNYDELPVLATPADVVKGDDVSHRVLLRPDGMDMYQYDGGHLNKVENIGDYASGPLENDYKGAYNLLGALPMRYCNYAMENKDGGKVPNITEYSYTNVVRVRLRDANGGSIAGNTVLLEVKGPCAVYPVGVFCISASLKYFEDTAMSPLGGNSWNGNLAIGFKLYVGSRDYTTDEDCLGASPMKCSYLDFGAYDKDTEYKDIENQKTLADPYAGAQGQLVVNPYTAAGRFLFRLLASAYPSTLDNVGCFMQNLSVKFVPMDGEEDADNGSDRIYENVINEDYINELDDIELKISSYHTGDGACYGKLVLSDFAGTTVDTYLSTYLTDNLYNALTGGMKRPEELLITRIVNRYAATRLKMTQTVKADAALSPLLRLTDDFLPGKQFINAGGSINYRMNQFECKMIEL